MKQFKILLLLFLLSPAVQSQQNEYDSLHLALRNAANDTIRMDALTHLGFFHQNKNIDSAAFYWSQAVSIAQKLQLKLYEAGLLSTQAFQISWTNYPKALELSLQALKIAEDPASEKNVWNMSPGNTPHTERLDQLGYIYFNMAQLYGNTGNIEKQVSSLQQSINILDAVKDSGMSLLANLNLGSVYLDKFKKQDSALYFEQRALKLYSKSNNDKSSLGWIFGAIGAVYLEKKNFDSSRFGFQKGLQLMLEQNDFAGIGRISLSLSDFYKTINQPDSSLLYAYKALETYKAYKDTSGIADAYSAVSAAYIGQNSTESAFAYLKLATALHDSLNNVERKSLLAYQNANLDEQMRLKNLEKEKIQTQAKIKTYAMLAGIAVFMAIAFILYRNNRHRKKANDLLQKQKEEIAVQKENIEQTLVELKSTQAQLIQSEKMASLGELTAGIAHEIQNPLNFVNNFSEVNDELISELVDEVDKKNYDEVKLIATDIKQNLEKINHHGKRADAIVKGMLQHSRKSSGTKEPTNINTLCDEYLRLSYHGLRAKDKSFNADFKTEFDESIGKINIVPQDMGRVLLNLFNNAFYAVSERLKAEGIKHKQEQTLNPAPSTLHLNYKPLVSIQTKKIKDKIEISVKDNGSGIPQNIVDKIFQPFFTTKPTGQGTGLGLSLAYDIITKEHNGTLKVESKEDEGSIFIIQLPLA